MPIKIVFEAGPVGSPATFSNELSNVKVNNWNEVTLIDLAQFHGGGGADACSELTTALDIMYTADHELLAGFSVKHFQRCRISTAGSAFGHRTAGRIRNAPHRHLDVAELLVHSGPNDAPIAHRW